NLFIDPILLKVNGLYKGGDNQYRFEYVPGGAAWDFKDSKDREVKEGQYIYQITGHVDYKGAKEQKYQYNIVLDNTAPELKGTYDEDDRTITVTAHDDGSGVFSVGYENTTTGEWYEQQVRKDGQYQNSGIVDKYSYTFKVADGFDLSNLSIYAWDNSRNVSGKKVDTGVKSDIAINPIVLKVKDQLPTDDQIKKQIAKLPEDAEFKIIENNVSTEQPGEYGIKVSVKVNGNVTYYWIPVNVIGTQPIELTVGDDVPKEEEIKQHITFLPRNSEVTIVEKIKDTKTAGDYEIKVKVKIGDKEMNFSIPVVVKEKKQPQPQPKDTTVYNLPVIKVTNPDYYQAFGIKKDEDYNKIHVVGNVTHINDLKNLTLTITKGGEKVEGTEVQKIKFNDKNKDGEYTFDHELDISGLKDGSVYELQIKAEGLNVENKPIKDTIIRRIRKDFEAPTIEYTKEHKDPTAPTAKIKVKGHENMTYLEMYLDGNMLSRVDKTWDAFELENGVTGEFEIEVPLEVGENKFKIKAYDDAGNETIQEVSIPR
ncbi:MAG: peptidase S8, partial [Anaerococcus obesiensis]